MSDLTTRKRFATTVDKKLLKKLDKLSEETRIPKSKLIDESIELLLKEHNN